MLLPFSQAKAAIFFSPLRERGLKAASGRSSAFFGRLSAWLYFQNQHSTAFSRQMSDMQNQQDPKALIKKVLAPIAEDMAAVDAVIRSELASDVPRMKEISEYITSAGGKRMRPALLMLICRALGYEGTLHQYLGATIELLHTATLMHDDVVDESDMRRGRPTANSRWGNGAAVLVVSEEVDELFEICDRIAVMYRGHLSPAVPKSEMNIEIVGRWMSGLWPDGPAGASGHEGGEA